MPDNELVACCYLEYARESAFIRDTLRCYRDEWLLPGGYFKKRPANAPPASAFVRKDGFVSTMAEGVFPASWGNLERIESIGYAAEVFVRGCAFSPATVRQSDDPEKPNYRHPDAPPITGSFPAPWQSLDEAERKYRANVRNHVEQFQIVPIKLSHWSWAKEIARECQRAADEQHEQRKTWERNYLRKDARGNFYQVEGSPAAREFAPIRPRTRWGVDETLMIDIAWDCFTNDEITKHFRQWVKTARPKECPIPDDKGHNKARDWRVALERLGMMRLLHQLRLREMPAKCPKASQLYGKREWYKERKRAAQTFRKLFPFLSKKECPLCWPTKGGRSK